MKLATKFALSFIVVAVVVLSFSSYLRVRREADLFERDMRRDHTSLGRDLAAAVSSIWLLAGESAAREFVNQANASKAQILIELTEKSAYLAKANSRTSNRTSHLTVLTEDSLVVHLKFDTLGEEWLSTFVPLVNQGASNCGLQLSESLKEKENYIAAGILRSTLFTILIAILSGIVAMSLGTVFVARPVSALIAKARRIASGDLSGEVILKQKDELGQLATELSIMSDQLTEASRRISVERSARQRVVEQLRHADRLSTVGRMSAAVAHELGTPLNVIKARARMISEGEITGLHVIESSRIIVDQSDRMANTITGLLNLSRRHTPRKERVDLRLVVQQTVDLLKPLARKSRVEVRSEVTERPVVVHIDPDQIRHVLSNLVINGIEAMPAGGTIMLRMMPIGSGLQFSSPLMTLIEVCDTGLGIAPEILEQVFDPFFSTKDPGIGTGLGLSISADIIREHGGHIEVESAMGSGSTFRVFLPLAEFSEGRQL